MASELFEADPADETWTLADSDGKTVVIVKRGTDVLLDVGLPALPVRVRFDGAQRDLFVRCFMEAERRAETPGQVTP